MTIIWIDAQLSPSLALWINENFPQLAAKSLRSLGLLHTPDRQIFMMAGQENVVIMTKDEDFVRLSDEMGAPPKIIWITAGNTSNNKMKDLLRRHLNTALILLKGKDKIVELTD
jgi:predicted nuclease of predicted toxin-antitoxin system